MTPTDNNGLPPLESFDPETPVSEVDEQAATWLIRLTSGNITAEERAAFARWRAADPAHEAALSAMRAIWSGLPVPAVKPQATTSPAVPRRRSRRRAGFWALAASLLIAISLGYPSWQEARHDEVTAAGERRALTLADGSVVILSGDTALDVDLRTDVRGIHLVRGEAYFEVHHDNARPFIVDAGFGEVRVTGTRFSVRRDSKTAEVTVAEGQVRVSRGTDSATLDAGQHLTIDRRALSKPNAVDAERELAWKEGRLILERATLVDVARLLNRHGADRYLVLVDSQQQPAFNTVIDLDHVDEWLIGLEQQGRGQVMRLGPVTLIY